MSRVRIIELEPKVMRRDGLFREMVRGFAVLFRDMWRGLVEAFAILPLRAVTGRRHPDYRRIAALELDLGMREPVNIIEKLSGISCPVKPHEPLVLGQSWEFIPLPQQPVSSGYAHGLTTINEARRWMSDYERGQDEARAWLDHLGHDHEPDIDVTPIGSPTPQYIRGRCLTGPPATLENLKSARRMTWEQLRDLTHKLSLSGGPGLAADEKVMWDSLQRQLDHLDQVIATLLRQQHD